MLSYVVSSASNYFYLPIEEEADADVPLPHTKYIAFADPCDLKRGAGTAEHASSRAHGPHTAAIEQILAQDDLYAVLGLSRTPVPDSAALRRAYLARTKACHPDKFAGDPAATLAFQKVSLAYSVLADPARRRRYDAGGAGLDGAGARAEDTLRGVVLGVFNDFLEGDMEVVRTLLRAMDSFSPALRLNDEGIESVLLTLQTIRDRLLTARALSHTLVSTLSHLVETQHSLSQLPYLALRPRARLSVRLARITLALPLAFEDVLWLEPKRRASRARRRGNGVGEERGRAEKEREERERERKEREGRRTLMVLLEGVVCALEKVEGVL